MKGVGFKPIECDRESWTSRVVNQKMMGVGISDAPRGTLGKVSRKIRLVCHHNSVDHLTGAFAAVS